MRFGRPSELVRALPAVFALVAVAPVARAQLALTPATQTIVAPGQGSLTLTLPAPSVGVTSVDVTSSNPAVLAYTFWFQPGSTSFTIPVYTSYGADATLAVSYGGATASATVHVTNPAPVITAVFPETIEIGADQPFLQVFDASFPSGPRTIFPISVVEWNGHPVETTIVYGDFNLPTFLWATVPRTLQPGTATITVVNPPPGGGTSAPLSVAISRGAATAVPALSPLAAAGFVVALAAAGAVLLLRA